MPEDPAAGQIARAVLQLAAGLGMEAVADGIERPEQLPFLLAEGCALGQGFHLGRPVPAEQVLLPAALDAGRRPEGSSRTAALPI